MFTVFGTMYILVLMSFIDLGDIMYFKPTSIQPFFYSKGDNLLNI